RASSGDPRLLRGQGRQVQDAEDDRLRPRVAARPEREALQAQAARSVLGRTRAGHLMSETSPVLRAPFSLEFTYTRSVGPLLGAFLDALGQRRILGTRANDGRVIVPPQEYDPVTADDLGELVEVGDAGVVTTWTWTDEPKAGQPLDKPFAWALI